MSTHMLIALVAINAMAAFTAGGIIKRMRSGGS